jgi:hypothetical protein
MERVRLTFDVRGENVHQIKERAESVVREFMDVGSDKPLDLVSEMEINIEGTPGSEHSDPPMPSYNFIGHVHVRIKS